MLLHLKNYRRPDLQRLTIRILWMVPIYAVASFTSLSSKSASDYIDTVRDIYEAFVIYTFFTLLINYLGGERALLAMLEQRMRIHHLWPFNLCFAPMDMSDPETFLFVRRGVLQFVILKPILAVLIMLMKVTGHYHEGYISWGSTYLWFSLIYNVSVCWGLYCLGLFYVQCERDLLPYRPLPKFVCVKVIVFLTFWQGLFIAFLVRVGFIRGKEDYSADNMALAVQDFLICIEITFIAMGHYYAFPWTDYNDSRLSSRVALLHSVRDAFGVKDIVQDTYHTFKGTTFRSLMRRPDFGMYEEESEYMIGQGDPRFGRRKSRQNYGSGGFIDDYEDDEDGDRTSLEFPDVDDPEIEAAYERSRELVYGDFNFPVIMEDPRFRNPPVVQKRIDAGSERYRDSFARGDESASGERSRDAGRIPPSPGDESSRVGTGGQPADQAYPDKTDGGASADRLRGAQFFSLGMKEDGLESPSAGAGASARDDEPRRQSGGLVGSRDDARKGKGRHPLQ